MKVLALFPAQDADGNARLVLELAWMLHELGMRVLMMDLDPELALTRCALPKGDENHIGGTAWNYTGFLEPTLKTLLEDATRRSARNPAPNLIDMDGPRLLTGDPCVMTLDVSLESAWSSALKRHGASRTMAARRTMGVRCVAERIGAELEVELAILHLGIGASALNRAACMTSDALIVTAPEHPISVRAMESVGPTLNRWHVERGLRWPKIPGSPTTGPPTNIGYILRSANIGDFGYTGMRIAPVHPKKTVEYNFQRLFRRHMLSQTPAIPQPQDPWLLGQLKYSPSLDILARVAGKPSHSLTAADGAVGSLAVAVSRLRQDYEKLGRRVAERCGLSLPS